MKPSTKTYLHITLLCLLLPAWLISHAFAADPSAQIGFLIEPAYSEPQVFQRIEGSEPENEKAAVLVPAHRTKYGHNRVSKEEIASGIVDWPDIQTKSRELAETLADKAKVEWVRDERKIILYGILTSDDPFIASVIFSKKFVKSLRPILGDELLAIIPSSDRIYFFPKFGNKLEDFAGGLQDHYQRSSQKVSLEIFHVSSEKVKIIGTVGKRS